MDGKRFIPAGESLTLGSTQPPVQSVARLIIAFNGAGGQFAGGNPDFADFVGTFQSTETVLVQGLANIDNYYQALVYRVNVREFIRRNGPAEIVIFGYSRGGNTAVELANALANEGVAVKALVTFDPHRFFGDSFSIGANVETGLNYYQTNPTDRRYLIDPRRALNPYVGSRVDGATNTLYTQGVNHINIIRRTRRDPVELEKIRRAVED